MGGMFHQMNLHHSSYGIGPAPKFFWYIPGSPDSAGILKKIRLGAEDVNLFVFLNQENVTFIY